MIENKGRRGRVERKNERGREISGIICIVAEEAKALTKNNGIPRYLKLGVIRQQVQLLVEADVRVKALGSSFDESPVVLQAQSKCTSLARGVKEMNN